MRYRRSYRRRARVVRGRRRRSFRSRAVRIGYRM